VEVQRVLRLKLGVLQIVARGHLSLGNVLVILKGSSDSLPSW
jgi:hypothetical protein